METRLTESIELFNGREGAYRVQVEQALQQVESKVEALIAMLVEIELDTHEMYEPMTVILGLGELLLSQVDPDSSLAVDLAVIVEQTKRMHGIMNDINRLIDYEIRPPPGSQPGNGANETTFFNFTPR
jgi:signal transduction histidine kinase